MTYVDEKTIEHNRNTVKTWLLEQKYSIEERRDPGQAWALYGLEVGGQFSFGVSELIGHPELITIGVKFSFQELQQDLERMPANEREDFLLDLWFKLLALDITFLPLGDPLNGVQFMAKIYVDELKRSVFWRHVQWIRRAYWIAQWTFQRRFSVPVSVPVASSDSIN